MHFLFVIITLYMFEFLFDMYSRISAVALVAPVAQEVHNILKNGCATKKMVWLMFSNSTKFFKYVHKFVYTICYYQKIPTITLRNLLRFHHDLLRHAKSREKRKLLLESFATTHQLSCKCHFLQRRQSKV